MSNERQLGESEKVPAKVLAEDFDLASENLKQDYSKNLIWQATRESIPSWVELLLFAE